MPPSDLRVEPSFEPRRPALAAVGVFVATMLLLFWPMLGGQFLVGPLSDQYGAGYAFRWYGATYFREHGAIPLWNPYLFGGMPFVAAMHGDIFYPTAWLRWILPVDTAMNLAFALHLVLAGVALYAFLRALRLSWTAATVGGLGYELTGILASLVSPGHDGKLFVSALAPLMFLALLRAVRRQEAWGYGVAALVTGLALLSPHYQMTYYLLVAAGLWTLWLAFLDPERPAGLRWPVPLALALAAVLLGVVLSAVQAVPFLRYLPYAARGSNQGWEYATSFALPVEELVTTVLPQFNGVRMAYWGQNFFKLHSEYLGAAVLLLAVLGAGDRTRGRLRWALLGIGGLFLLVAFGGHTPFYRLWYEVMPMMKKVRAPGMAFFLPAMVTCAFAGFGVERLLEGRATTRAVLVTGGILAAIGLLGAVGGLQPVAEGLARPELIERAVANAGELRTGGLRLLVAALAALGACWAIAQGRLRGGLAAAALLAVTALDLWSVDRLFFTWSAPATKLYAEDALTQKLKAGKEPARVMDIFQQPVYEHSILMGYRIPQVFGYHGNEVRYFDDVWGGKNVYRNVAQLHLWDLYAVQYLLLHQAQPVPGYHQVAGPAPTAQGGEGVLLERDSAARYVRVLGAAAKLPDSVLAATVADPRFPLDAVLVLPDTSSATVAPLPQGQLPPPPPVTASLAAWEPGRMTVALTGQAAAPTWLLVSETWAPGWRAEVDGAPAPVRRGDAALVAVELPPGAKEVRLRYEEPAYEQGKLVSLAALLACGAWIGVPLARRRRSDG